jgi:intracellular multiplication protein IcmB
MGVSVESFLDGIDTILAWFSVGAGQTVGSYCEIQTADSETVLATHDGSLISILELDGINALIGQEEFQMIHDGVLQSLQTTLSSVGHLVQIHFNYQRDTVGDQLKSLVKGSRQSIDKLELSLSDLVDEREVNLIKYCAHEQTHLALWTRPSLLSSDEQRQMIKEKTKTIKETGFPAARYTQNIMAAFPELRDAHDAFVRSVVNDLNTLGADIKLLYVKEACRAIRQSVDTDFTDPHWEPILPGDTFRPKIAKQFQGEISELLWPSLAHQLFPRDAENLNLRTARIGDRIYASIFIDLFPKEMQAFSTLFNRVMAAHIPWRIAFNIQGGGLASLRVKRAMAGLLSFASSQNRLINDAVSLLDFIELNSDDSVIKLRVTATTWTDVGKEQLLRSRLSQLSRAIQGWGSCDVSEFCGDAFEGVVSSILGISSQNCATTTVASLSDTIYMLPLFRPSSPWREGSLLFRTPDGKLWPYQPGSSLQTTWIDLIYARPGSGKSVLSNALNLALCIAPGNIRLPRISIVDIGPSSSGLISLLQEALPPAQRHLVAYHRLQMTEAYSINPFDTQLGCRLPLPQDRAFLINFMTLLMTPVGSTKAYDAVSDMAGMVIDEAYKQLSDTGNPNVYTPEVEEFLDAILDEIGFVVDPHTTWWEVTDALFVAGFEHEAMLAQRNAVPLLGDMTSICRLPVVEDLYGNIIVPTGEKLIDAFNRVISAAIREYPILSTVTKFDLGEARIISLDLDEVAKGGGAAADRQTTVMYMLARYILGRNFYLNRESVNLMPETYQAYHEKRANDISEDQKRLVFDEFHRTARAESVREQMLLDMREGRKWNVQIALISQSLEDFDSVMVEFGTSVFIMDAGPEQAIRKTSETFGLSKTAQAALRQSVRGPREGGATFLAQFATKEKNHLQLLTLTLGPIELWAFSTTVVDTALRRRLYSKLGPSEARRILGVAFPQGSAVRYIESQLQSIKEETGIIDTTVSQSVLDDLADKICAAYERDENFKRLVF